MKSDGTALEFNESFLIAEFPKSLSRDKLFRSFGEKVIDDVLERAICNGSSASPNLV